MDWIGGFGHLAALLGAALGVWGIVHDFRGDNGRLTRPGLIAIAGLCLAAALSLAAGIGSDMRLAEAARQAAREASARDAQLGMANTALSTLQDETGQLRRELAASETRERDLQQALAALAEAQAELLRRNAEIVIEVEVAYADASALLDAVRREGAADFVDWIVEEGRRFRRTGGGEGALHDLCDADTRERCVTGEGALIRFQLDAAIMEDAIARFGGRAVMATPTVFVVDLGGPLSEQSIACARAMQPVLKIGPFDGNFEDPCSEAIGGEPYIYDHLLGIDALDADGRDFAENPRRGMTLGSWDEEQGLRYLGFDVGVQLSGFGRLDDLAGRRLGVIVVNDVFVGMKDLFPDTLYSLRPRTLGDVGFSVSAVLRADDQRIWLPPRLWAGQPLERHALATSPSSDDDIGGWRFRGYAGAGMALLAIDFPTDATAVSTSLP